MKCITCGAESFVTVADHRWCCNCGRLDNPDGDGFCIPSKLAELVVLKAYCHCLMNALKASDEARLKDDVPATRDADGKEAQALADIRAALAPDGGKEQPPCPPTS